LQDSWLSKVLPFLINIIASERYIRKLLKLFWNLNFWKWQHLGTLIVILLVLLRSLTRRLILNLKRRIINKWWRHIIFLWILSVLGRWILILAGIHLGNISLKSVILRWELIICWIALAIQLFILNLSILCFGFGIFWRIYILWGRWNCIIWRSCLVAI
jgi:hypothetical protein